MPQARALVGLGGFVPFAGSVQTKADGGKNTFDLAPLLSFNHFMPFRTPVSHLFSPEFGLVFHGSNDNKDYSKTTTYILLDLGYLIQPSVSLRYGLGLFFTSIRGAGGTTEQRNGNDRLTFHRPSQSNSAANASLNLGMETMFNKNWSLRTELFLFSPLSSLQRKLSYLLGVAYYL